MNVASIRSGGAVLLLLASVAGNLRRDRGRDAMIGADRGGTPQP
jgi:hypothetical protein